MFEWKVKDIKATNAIFLAETGDNDGRPFKSRFLQAGLVKYDFGVCLLKKETIDKFVNTFINQPVIIGHKDDIKKDDVVGYVHNIWFSPEDGWFWCDGKLTDKEAIKKVEKGFNVSCQYRITEYSNNTEKKLHNGNPYDKEILSGIFEHLAIVENPRYEDAFIAVNAYIAENEDRWITIKPNGEENKGRHLLLKDGETPGEAIQRVYGNKDQTKLKKNESKDEFIKRILNTEVKKYKPTKTIIDYGKQKKQGKRIGKMVIGSMGDISLQGEKEYVNTLGGLPEYEEIKNEFIGGGIETPMMEMAYLKAREAGFDKEDSLDFAYSIFEKDNLLYNKLKNNEESKATNSFVEQFKNMLYETLAEGIYKRLGEYIAQNEERWITIKPHGEESEDYRRLKLEDGETPKEAIKRQWGVDLDKKKKEGKEESEKEVISESKEYTLQKNRIRTLVKQGFDKKQYYEKLDSETSKLWKAYTKAMRETTIYWDDSEDDKKIKKEKLESIHEEYAKKRDERNKAVQELNAITRETKAQQIEIINNIKENIDIEKSLKSYNSSGIDKKIKKVIDEYDINKINLERKEINEKLEGEKNKWLKYINSASSVEEQNKRLLEYDKWYKDSDIKKKEDELIDKIVNFSENRNKAISEALQIENGGDFRLTTVKGSKLTQKINKTNQLLSGIIDKNYIPDFSPFANGQAGRANACGNIINITSKEPVEIYIHESMHWLERVNPKMLANSLAFLEYRTKGEEAQSLKKLTKVDYRANEYAKPDNFFNAYCGKIYDNATEIMSMGIQRLFEDPKEFMEKDKEYFDFVIANLQGKI